MNKVNAALGSDRDKLMTDIAAILSIGQASPWIELVHRYRNVGMMMTAIIGIGALSIGATQSSGFVASIVAPLRRAILPDHPADQIILRPYRPPSSIEIPIVEASAGNGQLAPSTTTASGLHSATSPDIGADWISDRSPRREDKVEQHARHLAVRHLRHRHRVVVEAADDLLPSPPMQFGRKNPNIKLVEKDARLEANDAIAALRGR